MFDIFNGGANRAALYRGSCQPIQRGPTREAARQGYIEVQVEEAYLNLTNAKERLAASDVGLKAAQTNYDNQKARYAGVREYFWTC